MIYLNYSGVNAETVYNLYIGGVSSVITNATQLASYFSFSSSNVTEFATDGDNIKAFIDTNYTLNANAFDNSGGGLDWGNGALLTYFYDADNLMTNMTTGSHFYNQYNLKWIVANACTSVGSGSFRGCGLLIKAEFASCTTVSTSFNFNGCASLDVLEIPICTTLGTTTAANSIFTQCNRKITVITDTTLSTAQGGSPDGDLQYVTGTQGATVNYVANTTAPSSISDLTGGTATGTAIPLTFTPPSSTNTILKYEVWANGLFYNFIEASGEYVVNLALNTSYDIVVKTIDIYGNSSESNTITVSTASSYSIPSPVSYWNFDTDSLDQVGTNDGTDTAMSYTSTGGIGNSADFTAGSTSQINVADDNSLSFGNGTTDSPFAYAFAFKWGTVPTGFQWIFAKRNNTTQREYNAFISVSADIYQLGFQLFDQSTGGNITGTKHFKPSNGMWCYGVIVYTGSGVNTGIKVYINAIKSQFVSSSGSYTAMENGTDGLNIGKVSYSTSTPFTGYIDEMSLFSSAINEGQISDMVAKWESGTALTA